LNSKIILAVLIAVSFSYMVYSYFIVDSLDCSNEKGECYSTTVSRVIDGDTIKDSDDKSIRFSLASAPELSEPGGIEAKEYIESVCPVGSPILIDEDDLQLSGSYDRTIAKITCKGINLNQSLLTSNHGTIDTIYCNNSEFSEESWASECQ
jgi:micrococcal nuclease